MKRNVLQSLFFFPACAILISLGSAQSVPDRFTLTALIPDKVFKPGLQICSPQTNGVHKYRRAIKSWYSPVRFQGLMKFGFLVLMAAIYLS